MPVEIVTLNALGLNEYPKTLSGKVQRGKLSRSVSDYQSKKTPVIFEEPELRHTLRDTVIHIWSQAIGLETAEVHTQSKLATFADSITLMIVRSQLQKALGKTISIEDMLTNYPDIDSQVGYLESETSPAAGQQYKRHHRKGPPELADIVFASHDEEIFHRTKCLVEKTLAVHGLTWDRDVEDVVPAYDLCEVLTKYHVSDSLNVQVALLPEHVNRAVWPCATPETCVC